MLWQISEICLMALAILSCTSVFCLETLRKGKSIQSGRLIIGSSKTTNENKDDLLKKLHDKYVQDLSGNQSNQPALIGSQLGMLKLWRLSPSVQCDNDSMSLRIQGSRVPNFFVETSEEGSVPLFQMPSACGFTVKRARRDLALVAKYDGCNVVQQGDTYILPLRFLGVAVKVVCPMARPVSMVFCSRSAMVVNLCTSVEALWVKVNGVWQPVHQVTTCGFTLKPVGGGLTLTAPYASNCWQFEGAERLLSVKYMGVELTLSCPAVAALHANGHLGTPTDTPITTSTTKSAPASADQLASDPWYYPYFMPWHFQHGHPGAPSVTHTTTTPTTPTAAAVTASADQMVSYPWLHGMYYPYFKPWYFQHSLPGAHQVTYATKSPTTTTPAYVPSITTTLPTIPAAPASANQQRLNHWIPGQYRGMPWYFHYSHPGAPTVPHPPTTQTTTTTTAPTTSTTVAPSSSDQLPYPWFAGMYNPYVPVASPDISVSGPNSENAQQTYMSWMDAFPKYKSSNQMSSFPLVNPSNVLSYPAQYFPLQVKAGPEK
ncbi:uncharacterized protein LOC132837746 [Tachysurus vachellii]|uniref:uncharacterized protein LOC132837746 n=1 Tax=Tachysurus vachellii TaxID=175792 RepID=UPI00296B38D8|nr:uncharacterized protein LOC132837746 [Tachysurus vachellii]